MKMRKNDPKFEMTPLVRAILESAAREIKARETASLSSDEILEKILTGKAEPSFPNVPTMGLQVHTPVRIFEALTSLVPDYYKAIDRGNPQKLKDVLAKGFPVNFRNPHTGETALHRLAASGARPAMRVLLAHKDCDFLVRDEQDRLPSELAYLYGRDPALARLLGNKERKQAAEEGIDLPRRHRRPPVPSN
jgi:hypothetical protein